MIILQPAYASLAGERTSERAIVLMFLSSMFLHVHFFISCIYLLTFKILSSKFLLNLIFLPWKRFILSHIFLRCAKFCRLRQILIWSQRLHYKCFCIIADLRIADWLLFTWRFEDCSLTHLDNLQICGLRVDFMNLFWLASCGLANLRFRALNCTYSMYIVHLHNA